MREEIALHIQGPVAFFLRGINVNGIRISMADLKACLQEAGYSRIQTILATGNVVCVPPLGLSGDACKIDIERILTQRFAYPASVHLRTPAALATLKNRAAQLHVAIDQQCYALIADAPSVIEALATAYAALPSDSRQCFVACGSDALWIVPKGETLSAPFGNIVLGSARYKTHVTSRTMATIEKVEIMCAKYQ